MLIVFKSTFPQLLEWSLLHLAFFEAALGASVGFQLKFPHLRLLKIEGLYQVLNFSEMKQWFPGALAWILLPFN